MRRASRSSSTSPGARTSASTRACPRARWRSGRRRAHLDAQDRRGATQAAMLHIADGRVDAERVSRSIRLVRSTSPSSLLLASLDGARRQLALHGEQMLHETLQAIAEARAKLGRRSAGRGRSKTPTRCGSCSTCAPAAAPATSGPTRCGATTTSTSSWRRRRRSCSSSASASGPRRCGAWPATSRRSPSGSRAPGETSAIVRPPATLANEMAVEPARRLPRRGRGRRRRRRGRPRVVRVDRRLPAGHPALLPGERIGSETVAYLREIVAGGARLHGASDPSFASVNVLIEE